MSIKAKIPAIAYLRTSSAANVGTDKDSEKRQRAAIEAFAKRAGYELVDEFYDAAVSGADAIDTRPGFAAMLKRIEANGVNYYYEIHGQGEPLLLLHGGLGSIHMFGPVLRSLAQKRQVIAVDLHGHGRTPLGSRKIDLVDIGNDMAAVQAGQQMWRRVEVVGLPCRQHDTDR